MMVHTCCYKTTVFLHLYLQFFYQILSYFLFLHWFTDRVQAVWTSPLWVPVFCVSMPNFI